MTMPSPLQRTTSVCVEIYVDLMSRKDKRGWRVPVALEALAPSDPYDAVPILAECSLGGSDLVERGERTVFLELDGQILRPFHEPYRDVKKCLERLPETARHLPYFRRHNVDHGFLTDRLHAIDGMSVRIHPHVAYVPLDGPVEFEGGDEVDPGPMAAAVEQVRRLAASSLLRRSSGWFVSSVLPYWSVYEYNGRKAVVLTDRGLSTIGGTFAVDRLPAALAHGERLHGPGFATVGTVHSLAVERMPQASTDIVDLASRMGTATARLLASHVSALCSENVLSWHEASNVRELIASEGPAAAYRVLAGCERLMNDHLWCKTLRHEHGWRSERLRIRNELEAAQVARPNAPGMP